jgi:uncharacterized SAM-binding protein YcdF (DUF218 family)
MSKIDKYAKKLYNYHVVRDTLEPADIILIFTSLDLTVPKYAASLYLDKHLSKKILISGNSAVNPSLKNNIQETNWDKPEAEKFKDVMVDMGVPEELITTEIRSTNSQQNVEMTYALLRENPPKKIILVQKPTMGRRALATFKKHWPLDNYRLMVTSQDLTYEEYMESIDVDKDTMINIMVGDLQRILIYPEKGYMIHQDVPKDVLDAYEKLIELGYTKHLIP